MWTCWVGKGNCNGFSFASKEVTVVVQISTDDFTSTFTSSTSLEDTKKGTFLSWTLERMMLRFAFVRTPSLPQMHTPLQLQTWGVMFISVVGGRPNLGGIWRRKVVLLVSSSIIFPVFHFLFVLRDFTNFFVFVSPNFDKIPFLFLFACSFPSSGRTQKEQWKNLCELRASPQWLWCRWWSWRKQFCPKLNASSQWNGPGVDVALEILEMLLKVAELVLGTIISQGLQQSKLMMLIMTQLSLSSTNLATSRAMDHPEKDDRDGVMVTQEQVDALVQYDKPGAFDHFSNKPLVNASARPRFGWDQARNCWRAS